MKIQFAVAVCAALMAGSVTAHDMQDQVKQSKALIKEFAGQLKGELKAGMKSGGPVKAIEVCQTKAPVITHEMSQKSPATLSRVSLKTRNPGNEPNAWQTKVLETFEERKAAGEDPKKIAYKAVIEKSDGKHEFRFMKAIPTGAVCLNCHGTELKPEVAEKLKTLYPMDKATGYQVGDIRGAFVVVSEF